MTPRAQGRAEAAEERPMTDENDRLNLADVRDAAQALEIALEALRKAMAGQGPDQRERFIFQIGFARGLLSRVAERALGGKGGEPS